MFNRDFIALVALSICGLCMSLSIFPASVANGADYAWDEPESKADKPMRVYVPYEKLEGVFESEEQGVFLSYQEFQKLWRAAQGAPANVSEVPFKYLISTARFHGKVQGNLAALRLELTVDILTDDWLEVPLGLSEVAVSKVQFIEPADPPSVPLLRVNKGQYILLVRGRGRYVLAVDFVRQLETQPGLHVLKYRVPSAAITTLELLIPEENLKVDVKPLLAATTSREEVDGAGATRLQAFFGAVSQVELGWKPKTQAAAELEPVLVVDQFQHIHIDEALISHEVNFGYTIHRGGIDTFTIQLPGDFRVTDVDGKNIARWEIEAGPKTADLKQPQILKVSLFSPAMNKYSLKVKMERFIRKKQLSLPLTAVLTRQVLRRTGLIAITHSPRRLTELTEIKNLARVDTHRLPKNLRKAKQVTAYRFISSDYTGTIDIDTATPRITINQLWTLGVDADRLQLHGRLNYTIERAGVFVLKLNIPDTWKIDSIGPSKLVDNYQIKQGHKSPVIHVLLKKELTGKFALDLLAHAERTQPDEAINFTLPTSHKDNLKLYRGQLVVLLAEQLRAEVQKLGQLQPLSLKDADRWSKMTNLTPAMAFEFRNVDREQWSGVKLGIAVKPARVSALVHRLVNIQPGSIEQEAVIEYQIRYAPVDTFYLKMPSALADSGVQITGKNIKEKPRLDGLPPGRNKKENKKEELSVEAEYDAGWAFYKVVLHSKAIGNYRLTVRSRRAFQAEQVGQAKIVEVEPILAAGELSDQRGYIAIVKGDTLAIGEPVEKNLQPADPGSPTDLPYAPHRKTAHLAFKYNAPPFSLTLPVVARKEALVFTTIVSGIIIEQVLARDGMLNTHATYLLATSQGDRLPINLPPDAVLTAVLLNGNETPLEMGVSPEQRIVRLPPSAGQVSRFVLEISYSLKGVSASNLTAPALSDEIPIQQTLWRLWIPRDYYVLGFDRNFARLQTGQCNSMLRRLGLNQPAPVEFKLAPQGLPLHFIRQGPPGTLSVMVTGKEMFSIVVWLFIIAAGVCMLKLACYHRLLVILTAALAAGIVHLWLPLLVTRAAERGVYAAILIILLWIGQWVFLNLPKLRPRPQCSSGKDQSGDTSILKSLVLPSDKPEDQAKPNKE